MSQHTEKEIEMLDKYVENYLQHFPWPKDVLEHEKRRISRAIKAFARHLHAERNIILREKDIKSLKQ